MKCLKQYKIHLLHTGESKNNKVNGFVLLLVHKNNDVIDLIGLDIYG